MKKREEIAKELKYISRDCLDSGGLLPTLKRVLKVEDGSWHTVLSTLSDLIDPTCEMVVKNGHACCGRCGHRLAGECEVEEDYYEFRPFCPDCGAKVVSSDGV